MGQIFWDILGNRTRFRLDGWKRRKKPCIDTVEVGYGCHPRRRQRSLKCIATQRAQWSQAVFGVIWERIEKDIRGSWANETQYGELQLRWPSTPGAEGLQRRQVPQVATLRILRACPLTGIERYPKSSLLLVWGKEQWGWGWGVAGWKYRLSGPAQDLLNQSSF